ncbi:MAG TPA: hypothetical protein VGB18_02685 [Candidatus Thermoplasmatota archaeon]
MERAVLLVLAAAAGLPLASAQILLGTEDLPELPDAKGDVQYSPLYPGPQNLDYLDLNAGWFAYDNVTDHISVTMKTASATRLANAASTSEVRCAIEGDITRDNETLGLLQFQWIKRSNGTALESRVLVIQDTSAATGEGVRVRHQFEPRLEEPDISFSRRTAPTC